MGVLTNGETYYGLGRHVWMVSEDDMLKQLKVMIPLVHRIPLWPVLTMHPTCLGSLSRHGTLQHGANHNQTLL